MQRVRKLRSSYFDKIWGGQIKARERYNRDHQAGERIIPWMDALPDRAGILGMAQSVVAPADGSGEVQQGADEKLADKKLARLDMVDRCSAAGEPRC